MNKNMVHIKRWKERGNVFFTLFGAVAVLGVLGAGIMSTMRGPLTTMVEVKRKTQAESEMDIATKLIMMESIEAVDNGDCDGDGYVEPLASVGTLTGLSGGGSLPVSIASQREDPWGTDYGYCVWDIGTITGDACTTVSLQGDDSDADNSDLIIAVISAGTDKTFETTCSGSGTGKPTINRASGSDDIIQSFTYAAAAAASDGLWSIKLGNPDIAEIDKDIEAEGALFTGEADFDAGIDLTNNATSQLKLGAASLLLPLRSTDFSGSDVCVAGDVNLLRINDSNASSPLVEICNGTTWVSASSIWTKKVDNELFYDVANVGIGLNDPTQALDVVGNIQTSGNVMLSDNQSVTWATDGAIISDGSGITLNTANADLDIGLTVDVTGDTNISGDTIIIGSTNDNTADGFKVRSNGLTDIFIVQNDGNVGIGDSNPTDALDVVGDIDVTDSYMVDGDTILTNGGNASGIMLGQNLSSPGSGVSNYMNLGDVIHADTGATKKVGIGYADGFNATTLSDTFQVNGTSNLDGNTLIDGTLGVSGILTDTNGDLEINDNVDVTGIVTATDYIYGSVDFTPTPCPSGSFNRWTATGWACDLDTGGAGGGSQDLDSVLTQGNDANGNDALDFNDVGADRYCDATGANCFTANDVGTAVGSSIFEVATNIIRARNSAVDYATDDFVIGSPQLDDNGDTDHQKRMFFDKSKGAFRAGSVNATQWDDANIGLASVAFGINTTASGTYSTAFGSTSTASGDRSFASSGSTASNNYSVAMARGSSSGENAVAMGLGANASGNDAFAFGTSSQAQAPNSIVFGFETRVGATANSSVGFGLQTQTMASNPHVSGQRSMVLFMDEDTVDANSGLNISGSDIFAIVGGRALIDPTRAEVDVTSGLDLDVHGNIGAIQYCDEDGNNCFTPTDVAAAATGVFETIANVTRPTSGIADYANDDFVFGSYQLDDDAGTSDDNIRMFFDKSKGSFRAGYVTGTSWDDVNRGSYSATFGIGSNASGDSAFATGSNATASGEYSVAFGRTTIASGTGSLTFGQAHAIPGPGFGAGTKLEASGNYALAYGLALGTPGNGTIEASGDASTATGYATQGNSEIIASGTASYARGMPTGADESVLASGNLSTAWGIGIDAGSYIETSFGRYSDNTTGAAASWVATDTLFEIGNGTSDAARANAFTMLKNGRSIFGGTMPSSGGDQDLVLDIEGPIGATQYCDEDGNNCFNHTDITAAASSLWQLNGSDIYYNSGNVGIGTDTPLAALHSEPSATTEIGAIIKGAPSQTANLQEWRLSDDTIRTRITSSGVLITNSPTTSSAGLLAYTDNANSIATAASFINSSSASSAGARTYIQGARIASTTYDANRDYSLGVAQGTWRLVNSTNIRANQNSIYMVDTSNRVHFNKNAESPGTYNDAYVSIYGTSRPALLTDGTIGIATTTVSTGGEQDLELDVEGDIGAQNYCDEDGNNCFTHTDITSAASSIWQENGSEIYYSSGNVGIGTSNPTQAFEIGSGIFQLSSGSVTSRIQNAAGMFMYTQGSHPIQLGTAGTERVRIDASGNVGIGTTSPSSGLKLDVEGPVGATEYCDEDGNNCFTAMTIAAGSSLWSAGTGDIIYYNSGTPQVTIGTDTPSGASALTVDGTLSVIGSINAGQMSLNGTRTITTNTGNSHITMRALGRTNAGDFIQLGDVSSVATNSTGQINFVHMSSTVNQSGTASATDLLIDRTNTANGSGEQLLIDGKINGTSMFKVGTDGHVHAHEYCDEDGNNCFTTADIGTGLWTAGTGDDIYYDSGTAQVGIGTTSPSEALDVDGNINASGTVLASLIKTNDPSQDLILEADSNFGFVILKGSTNFAVIDDQRFNLPSGSNLGWSPTAGATSSSDLIMKRDAAGIAGIYEGDATTRGDLNVGDMNAERYCDENGNNCFSATDVGTGLWTAGTGDDIYYNSGNAQVGIGTSTPSATLDMASGINQVHLSITPPSAQTENIAELYNADGDLALKINNNGLVSTPSAGTNTLVLGNSTIQSGGSNSLAIGNITQAGGAPSNYVILGQSVTATGGLNNTVGVGSGITISNGATNNVIIGQSATAGAGTTDANVIIGQNASSNFTGSIVLGAGATSTAANQFIAGGPTYLINDVYFGKGAAHATPTNYTIHGTGGSGADVIGGDITVAGGAATGNAAGGSIIFSTSDAAASGTTTQTLTEKMRITENGSVGINTSTPSTGGNQDLELDVEGDIGAINYCDEDGNNCFTATDVGGTGLWTAGTGDDIYYDSGTPQVGIGTTTPAHRLDLGAVAYFDAILNRSVFSSSSVIIDATGVRGSGTTSAKLIDESTSATNPTLVPASGDDDTGIGRSSTNVLSLIAGGVNVLNLNDSGSVGINTTNPSSSGDQALELDVEGDIGAQNYCDEEGNNCFTASTVAGLASGTGVFETVSNVTRPTSGTADYSADDFVFGSYQTDDTGNTDHDARIFFDKSKGAFRAGRPEAAEWDNANIGLYSIATGSNSTASGNFSTAMGSATTASGINSIAIGIDTNAGSYAETSFGRFSDNTVGTLTSWVATDILFEIGNGASDGARANAFTMLKNGQSIFGGTAPSSALTIDVEGDIGAVNYCDENGNNCFTAAAVSTAVSGGVSVLNDLTDVDTTGLSTNDVLTYDGSDWIAQPVASSSLWTAGTGDDIYYNSGTPEVGIGTAAPDATLHVESPNVADSATLFKVVEDSNTIFNVTARNGATVRMGVSRFLNINQDGTNIMGIGNLGGIPQITTSDTLGLSIRSREDNLGAPYGIVLLNDIVMPTGVPLLKVGIGTSDTTTAEYFRIDDDGDVGIGESTIDGTLKLDVEGQIGATEYCDEDGSNCFAATDVGGTGLWTAGTGDDIYYNSGTPQVGIGTTNPTQALDVVGSATISNQLVMSGVGSAGELAIRFGPSAASSGIYTSIRGNDNKRGIALGANNASGDSGILEIWGLNNGSATNQETIVGYWDTSIAYLGTEAHGTGVVRDLHLFTEGNANQIVLDTSGNVGIGTTSPNSTFEVAGDIRLSGIFIDISDRRLKTDITPLQDSGSVLDKINALTGYSFRMKDDKTGTIEYGMMAQEVEEVFPELVQTADDEMGTKSLNATGLIAPLVEAAKELKAENEALKAQLAARDTRMAAIEAQMISLTADMKGVKAHTGYGINKATLGGLALLLLMMIGGSGLLIIIKQKKFSIRGKE